MLSHTPRVRARNNSVNQTTLGQSVGQERHANQEMVEEALKGLYLSDARVAPKRGSSLQRWSHEEV